MNKRLISEDTDTLDGIKSGFGKSETVDHQRRNPKGERLVNEIVNDEQDLSSAPAVEFLRKLPPHVVTTKKVLSKLVISELFPQKRKQYQLHHHKY